MVAWSFPSASQQSNVLIEACSALPDITKRAECFEAVARGTVKQPIPDSAKKYEGVNRTATAIQGAIDVGVTYAQYGPYVQQLSTEMSLFKQQAATDSEKKAIGHFDAALDAYRDAATFWEASIRFFAYRDNRTAYFGGLPLRLTGTEWLANKYSMPTRGVDFFGLHRGVPQSTALATIWRSAAQDIDTGKTSLSPPPVQAPVAAPIQPPASMADK